MKTASKVAAFAIVGLGITVGILFVSWSKEASVPAMQERIKERLIRNISTSSPVDGLTPRDISIVSYRQTGNITKRVEFEARVKVRRVPFHPTEAKVGDKLVPTGWLELDIKGQGGPDDGPGQKKLKRPKVQCYDLKVVGPPGSVGPDVVNERWRDGKNLDPNLAFDVFGRGLKLEPMQINFESLVALFSAREERRKGRFADATALLTEVHIAAMPEPQPWTDWTRAEQALNDRKSKDENKAPGQAVLWQPPKS